MKDHKHQKEISKGFKKYEQVSKASFKFFSAVDKLKINLQSEIVPVIDSLNRVLVFDFKSPLDVPPFKRAAMDGYAVISKNTTGASQTNPALLKMIGRLNAGEKSGLKVRPGTAMAIATGAKMPKGADSVAMVENTSADSDRVQIFKQVEYGKNVAHVGEDVQKGQILIKKGTLLTSQDIAIMSSVGVNKIPVYRKPRVAIFSTGNELVEPGSRLTESSIYESNRYMLSSLVKESGGEVVDLGICPDDKKSIQRRLKSALCYDIVIISGGTSVGSKDFVPEVINETGRPGVIVHGIAMRPGSPTALSIINKTPIISAPGYPVSAYFAFFTFARPLIMKLLKTSDSHVTTIDAIITKTLKLHQGMRTFLRVKLDKKKQGNNFKHYAEPISATGASLLSTLTKSNGFAILDNKSIIKKGERIQVITMRQVGGLD
ncbi:MAG: molybdopterin molybdotransferase MoeA [Thaumarchaeota archaeon]|nr:molybdopterin molybdotransferase MoeA [Nitrososphaerota archaeon]